MKIIGILGMQGAIEEHREKLKKLAGIEPVIIKTKEKLAEVDGLILPGGESTAMGRLLNYFNLTEPLKQSIEAGLPVWGTCAGMILLAKNIEDQDERYLSTMDITVKRNAYGSQLDSFSCEKKFLKFQKIRFRSFLSVLLTSQNSDKKHKPWPRSMATSSVPNRITCWFRLFIRN